MSTPTRITRLSVYPVKSTTGHDLADATVEPAGLSGDRRWTVADASGTVMTARKLPRLLHVVATIDGPGRLLLEGPHDDPLKVDASGPRRHVTADVFGRSLHAVDAGDAAAQWFSALVEREVRLLWQDRHDTFADAYPLLLTTTGSLRQLNDWIVEEALERGEPVPTALDMRRFRPNVVVDHDEPFAEDSWTRIRLGGVPFQVAKPCDRCVMTTIDPETLEKSKEPLRTLARHRRWGGKVWFGVNLVPEDTGTLRVGDAVDF